MGDVPFSLMMDILSQNQKEPCSFEEETSAAIPPGHSLPMTQLSRSLSLSETVTSLVVHVRFLEAAFLLETITERAVPGVGRKEAEMFLSDADLTYTLFESGSSRLHLVSKGVRLNDIRNLENDRFCIAVLSIDPSQAGDVHQLNTFANNAQTHLRRGITENSCLSPTNPHQRNVSAESASTKSGFVLDLTIQQREDNAAPGPMIMEVTAIGAHLIWPYFYDLSWIDHLSHAFTAYNCRPSCSEHPQGNGPDEWIFVNSVLKDSNLYIPLHLSMLSNLHKPMQFEHPRQGPKNRL